MSSSAWTRADAVRVVVELQDTADNQNEEEEK
jgi:hypothetical protein